MPISSDTKNFLESSYANRDKLNNLIAKLYGADVEIDLFSFCLQASQEAITAWLEVQKVFNESQGKDPYLKQKAAIAIQHALQKKAFEEGRKYAYSQDPNKLEENSTRIRNTQNPYQDKSLYKEQTAMAWADGFQSAIEVILGESW